MKRFAVFLLNWCARRVVAKYRPQVVGITGSYGKTSTKEAVVSVLSQAYDVRASAKSYNNEFGVPFTVLDAPSIDVPGWERALTAVWHGVILLLFRRPYPTVLILEMGADKPGDIKAILDIVPLTVGVVTSVGPTHLERFGSVENVFAEKSLVTTKLHGHCWGVFNGDDVRLQTLGEASPCRIVSYGFQSGVAIRCVDAAVSRSDDGVYGMLLTVEFGKDTFPVFLPGTVGRHTAYAALAAAAVGVAYSMDLVEIADGLKNYQPPPGRMRVLEGVKRTVLLDDTYNSSPDACIAAVQALREFPADGTRYALLGDMVDLGRATEAAHRAVGKELAEEKIDVFVGVGEAMKLAADEARLQGMDPDRVFSFDDPLSAARFVQERMKQGDTVLLKGSQRSRMEKATKELMAEPERAKELIVRQDALWLRTY